MGCCLGTLSLRRREKDAPILAAQTCFTVKEVEQLHELFRVLSSCGVDDGFICKEEFQMGLFRNKKRHSLLSDRIFDLFDLKHDGLIDFGEFIRVLSIFHPNAPHDQKVKFAFQMYDIWQTGYIEPEEVRQLILALLEESDLVLSDDIVQAIIEKTFNDVDSKADGKIDMEEWKAFVAKTPSVLKCMTIPYLKDIPTVFPSFVQREDLKEEI